MTGASGGPRVSIMVPVFRAASYVEEALRSVFAQVGADMEVLIFDDASDDGSLASISAAVDKYARGQVLVVRQPMQRGPGNMLDMVAQASGEVLIWCHGDDVSLPGRFARIRACFADPATMLVSSNAYVTDAHGHTLGLYHLGATDRVVADPALYHDVIGGPTTLGATMAWRRQLIEEFPGDPRMMLYGDDLVLPFRATLLGAHRFLREPLVRWRVHGGNAHLVTGSRRFDGVGRERYLALVQFCLEVRRDDVATIIRRCGETPALLAIRRGVDDFALRHLRQWLEVRGQLVLDGWDPHWNTRKPLRAEASRFWLVSWGQRLETRHGGSAAGLLAGMQGWYPPEDWGTWSAGSAVLVLRLPADIAAVTRVVLDMRGLSLARDQCCTISCQGETVWDGPTPPEPVTITIDIPRRLLPDRTLAMLFEPAPCARPSDDPGGDGRLLGIGLIACRLDRLPDDQAS